ncbi:3',5'-cyclic AMP phosphodiesterase CpdA [Oxalobacteraceae bacterium GrIS 2.11]
MKIIHLSDTHAGRDNNEARLNKLVQDILSLGDPDEFIVIHTGDLIDQGNEQQRDAGLRILAQLKDKNWRVLLCPGNHDYGNAMQVDPRLAQQFRDKFSSYIFGSEPLHFPVLHLLGDCALIGLDSNQGEMGWLTRWFAEGNLGAAQIAALGAMLDRADVRDKYVVLYLHHHPFFDSYVVAPDVGDGHYFSHLLGWNTRRFRRLKDAYSLLQTIRDRADMLLFGHQHYGYDYSAEGRRYGIPIALDGSSSTCTEMDTDRMRYRIIDTNTGHITTRLVTLPK